MTTNSSTLSDFQGGQRNHFLIVGGDGLIGRTLRAFLLEWGQEVTYTSRRTDHSGTGLDLQAAFDPSVFAKTNPDYVILAAGVSSVAECASNPRLTHEINVTRQLEIAEHWSNRAKQVIALSSSHVFSDGSALFFPNDKTLPSTEYGRQKVALEEGLRSVSASSLILRVTKVMGPTWERLQGWKESIESGIPISAYIDSSVSPVHVLDLARSIFELCESGRSNIVHLSSQGSLSYFDIARRLCERMDKNPELVTPARAGNSEMSKVPHQLGVAEIDRSLPANRWSAEQVCSRVIDESLS